MITASFWRLGALSLCLIAQASLFGASNPSTYKTVNYIHTLIFDRESIQIKLKARQKEQEDSGSPIICVDEFIKNELSEAIATDCKQNPDFWNMTTHITNETEQLTFFYPQEILHITGFKDLIPIEHRKTLPLSGKNKCFFTKKSPKDLAWLHHNYNQLQTALLCKIRLAPEGIIPELAQFINQFLPYTLLKYTPDRQEDCVPYYFNHRKLEHSKERLLLFSKNKLDSFFGLELHGRNAIIDEYSQLERSLEDAQDTMKMKLRELTRQETRNNQEAIAVNKKQQQQTELLYAQAQLSRANIQQEMRNNKTSTHSYSRPPIKPLPEKFTPASRADFFASTSGVKRGIQKYAQINNIPSTPPRLMLSCPI